MLKFLGSKIHVALTLLLVVEAAVYIAYPKQEIGILPRPLSQLVGEFGDWHQIADVPIEKEVSDVLKADDVLNRFYVDRRTGTQANLYVAFFKTQKTGVAPHSPKVCLPAEGFEPSAVGYLNIDVPGRAEPITVNHYVITRGEDKRVVLYWYQTHNRVIANEYKAKLNTIFDSMRYRRSDTAIVRIVVPMQGQPYAESAARSLAAASFEPLRQLLPQ